MIAHTKGVIVALLLFFLRDPVVVAAHICISVRLIFSSVFRRSLAIATLMLAVSGCGFFSSQDTTPPRVITSPLDSSRSFARSVSLLKEFDRIATVNLATSFSWWDSTGAVRQLREHYGQVMAVYFWNDTQPWSV